MFSNSICNCSGYSGMIVFLGTLIPLIILIVCILLVSMLVLDFDKVESNYKVIVGIGSGLFIALLIMVPLTIFTLPINEHYQININQPNSERADKC